MPGIEHDETPYDADTEERRRPALVTSAAPDTCQTTWQIVSA